MSNRKDQIYLDMISILIDHLNEVTEDLRVLKSYCQGRKPIFTVGPSKVACTFLFIFAAFIVGYLGFLITLF